MRVTRQFLINNANQIFQKIASMRDVLGTTGLDLFMSLCFNTCEHCDSSSDEGVYFSPTLPCDAINGCLDWS